MERAPMSKSLKRISCKKKTNARWGGVGGDLHQPIGKNVVEGNNVPKLALKKASYTFLRRNC